MHSLANKSLSLFLAVALITPSLAQDYAPETHLGADQIAACRALDGDLQKALEEIISKAFEKRLPNVDLGASIDRAWEAQGANEIIANRLQVVGNAIIEESSRTELLETLKSIWGDNTRIEHFIERIMTRTLNSPDVKNALSAISAEASEEVGVALAEEVDEQQGPLQACLMLNIGRRYGEGFARLVRPDLERVGADAKGLDSGADEIAKSRIPVIGLSGVALVALRGRIQRYVVRGAVRRTIGGALAKIVAEIATGIGIFLIAYDIWTLRNGFIPVVVKGMKEPEQLAAIKEGLKKATHEFLASHRDELAAATAEAITARWQEIERDYAALTELAEKHETFREFLLGLEKQPIAKIAELVGIVLRSGGEQAVLGAVKSGLLERAVSELGEAGVRIARDLASLVAALAWQERAGAKLALVEDHGLHRLMDVGAETPESLEGLLALGHRPAILRVARLDRPTRHFLSMWGREKSMPALFALSDGELQSLQSLYANLKPEARQYLDGLIISNPAALKPALRSGARAVVLASRDQREALTSLVAPKTLLLDLPADFARVVQGDVSARLLVHKHPLPLLVLGIVLAALLLSFLRLLFGRRTRVIVQSDNGKGRR